MGSARQQIGCFGEQLEELVVRSRESEPRLRLETRSKALALQKEMRRLDQVFHAPRTQLARLRSEAVALQTDTEAGVSG